ncbi:MAG: hypothetical protein J0I28_06485, partial [Caulobacterales bacterium]|nr:hypothetical protein [Caulobacterales bacterium]
MPSSLRVAALAVLAGCAVSTSAGAHIVRLEMQAPKPAFDGRAFGPAGAYEVITGVAHGELDPGDPKNRIVTDLQLAPRNAHGMVEYAATFQLARPVDAAKQSGVMVYSVVNRGTGAVSGYDEGHVSVISGWQGDIPTDARLQTISVPIAKGPNGAPVTGPTIARFVDMPAGTTTMPLNGGQGRGVPRPPPLSLDTAKATLYRQPNDKAPLQALAASDWAFADCAATPFPGKPDPTKVCVKGGFDPKFAYTLGYIAKDPPVLGIGYAATRDLVAFLRYADRDAAGNANPARGGAKVAVGAGISQSANFLRSLVQLGLNQAEDGRIVFDGIFPQNSLRENAMNYRFAIPGGGAALFDSGVEGVVWYGAYEDKLRGFKRASVFDRCLPTKTCPKVIEQFGASEMWGLRGSPALIGTDAKADIPLPANVRRYYNPGVTHGGGQGGFKLEGPRMAACTLAGNPNPVADTARAHLANLISWVKDGVEPPPSAYPTLAKGDLVTAEQAMARFPAIPGAPRPDLNPLQIYDNGPGFNAADLTGVPSKAPPAVTGTVPLRVPSVDADGNEAAAGVRSTLLQAPLGSYLGWNIAANGYMAGQNCGSNGGYIPFARTRAERTASGDPRPSLEERYGDHAAYVAKVKSAADGLV